MLHEAATRFPQRAYATKKGDEGWIEYSYSMVDEQSNYVCAALAQNKVASQSAFGLLAEGRPEWIIAEMGVIKHRSISVPLSIKLTPEEIAFRLTHSEAVGIIASSNTLDNICKSFGFMEGPLPVVYYLDEIDARLEKYIEQYKWKEGKDFYSWSALIELGKKSLEKNPTIVEDIEKTIGEDDTINICYTSGTTGNPKGIMLTHLNYWTNSRDAVELFILPDEVFETLVVLPVDHAFAHTVGIYTSMLRGITLHFVDARGSNSAIIRNFPKNLVEVNPYYLMTVPSISGNFMKKMSQGVLAKGKFINGIFQRGLKAGIERNGDGLHRPSAWTQIRTFIPYKIASLLVFPSLRKVFGNRMLYCVGGGALLEARQQHFFAAIGTPVYQGYGLTEAAPIISSNSPSRYKFGTSGVIAPSIKCRIMKSEFEEAKVGERGEIVIKGDNVMKGYFKNQSASDEVLKKIDGETWLFTGDLGFMDEDGFLVVTGRAKALLIAKDGEKYSPEEIEEAIINNCEIVNQLLVYNDHQAYTTALVTLQDDKVASMIREERLDTPEKAYNRIMELLRGYEEGAKKSIPSQWMPSTFAIIEKPFSEADKLVNSTMKLVRYKVIEYYQERIEQMYGHKDHEKLNIESVKNLFFND
jgi:long-chain acyl-CoA synthetase